METSSNMQRTLRLVMLAILLALVIVLQLWGSSIHVGFTSFSLVLIPIVLGGILIGPVGGMILGLVFGFIVLMAGVTGTDFFTATLFQAQPFMTALICLGKGACAGLAAGWVYRLVRNKNNHAAVFAAAAAAPIVNTGLFVLGALTLVSGTLTSSFMAEGSTLLHFVIIGCAGANFIVEFFVNLVVSPALYVVTQVVTKRL